MGLRAPSGYVLCFRPGRVHSSMQWKGHGFGARFCLGAGAGGLLRLRASSCARQVRTGRGVPVSSQLRSHQLFSQHFEDYSQLVDSATLYHTGKHPSPLAPCSPACSCGALRMGPKLCAGSWHCTGENLGCTLPAYALCTPISPSLFDGAEFRTLIPCRTVARPRRLGGRAFGVLMSEI